jgi:chromosome segregation ATPase
VEAIAESPFGRRVDRAEGDIIELKEDVRVLKEDVRELKEDVRILKQEVAELKVRMDRMCVVIEEMNEKLTLALELLQHCVSLIPSVHKHDLQIKGTKTDIDVTQSVLKEHIQNKKIHTYPKRGRPRKSEPGESL